VRGSKKDLRRIWIGEARCSGNRSCQLPGTRKAEPRPATAGQQRSRVHGTDKEMDAHRIRCAAHLGRHRDLPATQWPGRSTRTMRRKCSWTASTPHEKDRAKPHGAGVRRQRAATRANSRDFAHSGAETSPHRLKKARTTRNSTWPLATIPVGLAGRRWCSVFLAHDVQLLRPLERVEAGDVITYQTACKYGEVHPSSTPADCGGRLGCLQHHRPEPGARYVLPTQRPLLHLAALCWCAPPKSRPQPRAPSCRPPRPLDSEANTVNYSVPAPPALVAQGLTLDQNRSPHGHHAVGQFLDAFAQSPGPLASRRLASRPTSVGCIPERTINQAWWSAIAPGVTMPPELTGATVVGTTPAQRGD